MSSNIKKDRYEETFVSPFGKGTKQGALQMLDDIRAQHHGWTELMAYVEQHRDGLWYAVRKHAKEK